VEFPQRALEDFICVKGNGKPLFVLANAVDDRTMAITHVIRGEDQLPTTPRQIMLWGALNRAESVDLALPVYAHLPLLVNERGKKLSKRRDPVAVEMYRAQGYLPEAFRNYLALLGWSPGEEEILPLDIILARFRLEDVQRSPAFFDVKKLNHINGVSIRDLSVERFVAVCRPWVDPVPGEWDPRAWLDPDTGLPAVATPAWAPERFDAAVFAAVAGVAQERVTVLSEVPELVDFLFLEDAPDDPDSFAKAIAGDEGAPQILRDALAAYETCAWDKDTLHEVTLGIADAVGRKLGKAQAPIRVAVMGRTRGLPLFDSLAVLGRDETRRRLTAALARVSMTP
jgi:glutamyl-tRNA synthetase